MLYEFYKDERGSEPVEYIVVLGIIVVITGPILLALRDEVAAMFERILGQFGLHS